GEILKIVAEYPQGWLGKPIDAEGQKQASWRTNPEEAGASSCLGDIGTHAENLARYITGLEIEELCAEFTTFVEGRKLEDDANLLIRYKGGAKGVLYASQISAGEENSLRVRVYGSRASLEWYQEDPNRLFVKYPDAPRRVYRAGNEYLSDSAKRFARIPAGHPEAFLEAFANIYLEAARAIEALLDGQPVPPDCDFPTVDSGVEGMAFIATAVKSAKAGGVWTKMVAV
ncbi:MAG: Gfo/Idh/MocA family oxidoreductase, partial [Terrimicrobiaceae bacterium]